jgi:hypothetical protein
MDASNTPDLSKIEDTMVAILSNAVTNLTSKDTRAAGETRLWFPEGINFISVSVTFTPTKADVHGELVVSSKPVGKAAMTDEVEPVNPTVG